MRSAPKAAHAAAKAAGIRVEFPKDDILDFLKQVEKERATAPLLQSVEGDLRKTGTLIPFRRLDACLRKFKAEGRGGERVRWYYKDDRKFFREEKMEPREHAGYSGILVPKPGVENRGGVYDFTDLIVVHDIFPVEKCYPDVTWFTLERLLLNPDLVEVFNPEYSPVIGLSIFSR